MVLSEPLKTMLVPRASARCRGLPGAYNNWPTVEKKAPEQIEAHGQALTRPRCGVHILRQQFDRPQFQTLYEFRKRCEVQSQDVDFHDIGDFEQRIIAFPKADDIIEGNNSLWPSGPGTVAPTPH
jgi:hypothetical protein